MVLGGSWGRLGGVLEGSRGGLGGVPGGSWRGLWGSEGGPGGVLEESRGVLWVLIFFEGGLGGSWAGFWPILGGLGEAWGAHVERFWGHFGVSFSEWVREAPWDRFWAHLGAQNGSKTAPQKHLEEVPTLQAENIKNWKPPWFLLVFLPST